jgi:hypothetical protein
MLLYIWPWENKMFVWRHAFLNICPELRYFNTTPNIQVVKSPISHSSISKRK